MRVWEEFIKKQEALLGSEVVNQWLRTLKVVHFDSANLYMEAKDSFQVLWFEEHIRPLLKSKLLNNNFRPIKVHISVVSENTATEAKSKKQKEKSPLLQFTFDKLDPSMTLENFVVGNENLVLSRFLNELIGSTAVFNPIYFWGSPGCGKTHLLIALAQAFRKRGLNALYARAETFTEHVVSAIRASEMQVFRKAYRHVDVLLIDDVHLLARKWATQEEFFHTFNALHSLNRQIILSSKCAPPLMEEIEPRLISRFEWGINIHFEKLVGEERKQMLEKRCDSLNFPLDPEVIQWLLHKFQSSKSLNRALEALVLRSHLEKKRNLQHIDKKAAEKMLADLLLQEEQTALSPEKIISAVSTIYGIRNEDLLGKSQSQECSLPRQIAMYLCRQELKLPFQSIGRIFGRDHSTVMTSITQVEKKLKEKELYSSLLEIKGMLN